MEKLIYALSRPAAQSPEVFAAALVNELAGQLAGSGVRRLTIGVNDADVAAAAPLRIVNHDPAIDAVACLWVDSANQRRRWEALLSRYASSIAGYLVTESEPLRNPAPVRDGERTPGMMQIVFLRIPAGMDADEWYSIWRDEHTDIAIETQATFIYRQNLVVRSLTPDAPECAAIVEEALPAAAMTSQHAFYDAVGDDEKLERNRTRMLDSCRHFVDLPTIEVLPTSEYTWGEILGAVP